VTEVLTETFNTNPGYDNSWSETVGSGGTLDEDTATSGVTGAPARWGAECLHAEGTGGAATYAAKTLGAAESDIFVRFEFILNSHSIAASSAIQICVIWNSAWTSVMAAQILNISGTLYIQYAHNDDGGGLNFTSGAAALSLDTPYVIELKWDVTNDAFEGKLNGAPEVTKPLTSTYPTDPQRFRIGVNTSQSVKMFIGHFAIDDAAYPPAPTAGQPMIKRNSGLWVPRQFGRAA
jgi:hypothetical protein